MGRRTPPLLGYAIATLLILAARPVPADEPDPADLEFFESKVRPVLVESCFECHGAEKQKGDLRLDSPDAMRIGGPSGPAVEPGDPESSPLIEAVRYDGVVKMPPRGKLAKAEVAALEEWVRRGAPWPLTAATTETAPETGAMSVELARDFWAFQPVREPVVPGSARDGAETPIDRFLGEKLKAAGLSPAPGADRRTLIRRLAFDLTGLPPSPTEVEAFVTDPAPDAYERLVDRLLASPRYGERWGRHWLDIARYAEDQAHAFQPRLYPNGYRYRDWVVGALNGDLPYDTFLKEQVAADLLDAPDRPTNLPALGFFACGPVYYGDKQGFDQIDDRIDTLTRGVLGLTVACARCHDHKYDPIPQADYYALAGVIASTDYDETPLAPEDVVLAYKKAQEAILARGKEADAVLQGEADRLVAERVAETSRYLIAAYASAGGAPREEVAREAGLDPRLLGRWTDYLAGKGAGRPELAPWRDRRPKGPDACESPESPEAIEEAARAFQSKLENLLARSRNGDKIEGEDRTLLDELTGEKGVLGLAKDRVERAMSTEARTRLEAIRAEAERLKAEAPPMYPVAHALKEGQPRDLRLLTRGNPESPGEEVPRRFLSAMGGTALNEGSGRLALAEVIASADNPLTARVLVNRVWRLHFGRGLVSTPSNFGTLGERPSHPELLDWLAARFVASGWSIKALHREILLSAAYRRAGLDDPRALEIDPENRLLWRMDRRRLEVEAWRDAILDVTGRLDPLFGGASVPLSDPQNLRRTLYAKVSRHDLDPLLRLFDFPDPNITAGERSRTTVPLQGLYVLNDEFMIEAARALAARLTGEVGEDDGAFVARAYPLLFGRTPSDDELRLGLAYLGHADEEPDATELTRRERYAHVLLGTNEFTYID